MMHSKESKKKIQDYLNIPETRSILCQKLQEHEYLKISIGQVEKIIGTDAPTLRRWDKTGLITLNRTTPGEQRLYGIQEIARLLIIKALLDEYPLDHVTAFLQQDPQVIEKLINEMLLSKQHYKYSGNMLAQADWAEEAFFWRTFVSRTLYLSMRLLFEETAISDNGIWLLLPLQLTTEVHVKHTDELADLGEILLGWYSNENPFFTCITTKPIIELPKRYKVFYLSSAFKNDNYPVAIHLLVDGRSSKKLEKIDEYALRGTGRLLKLLHDTQAQWRPYLQEGNDFTIYNAPEFKKTSLGMHTLNKMADRIVELGGSNKQQQPHWYFCCILLPREEDPNPPLKRRHLVIQGQSAESPHEINKTKLSPSDTSLSMRAYHSNQIIYRADIADDEPDIASHEQEKNIKSAIAIPIEGRSGQPLGVLYIASRELDAFSKRDDLLLLRITERIIAEQLIAYQMRSMLVDNLSEVIARPQMIDRYFDKFRLHNEFTNNLEEVLAQIRRKQETATISQPFHHLTLISVGLTVDSSGDSPADRATDRAAKGLFRDVGKRIAGWMNKFSSSSIDIQMYCMYAENYYLLLKNVSEEDAARYSYDLQSLLLKYTHSNTHLHSFSTDDKAPSIYIHLGVISYTYAMLQDLLAEKPSVASMRVKISHVLEDALDFGKSTKENNIVIWRPQDGFIFYHNKQTDDDGVQTFDKRTIKRIANEVINLLQSENRLPSDDKKSQ
jgi:DNA-binding transcriptional MerR regulator